MRAHPMLNVGEVTPDPELLQKIPHAMAFYYMALPIASEDGEVSVAMEHPENTTALAVLSHLLGSPIVPVRGVSDAIHAALQLAQASPPPSERPVIGFHRQACLDGFQTSVAAWTAWWGAALDAQPRLLETTPIRDEDFSVLAEAHPRLIVMDAVAEPLRLTVLARATAPIFFVHGCHQAASGDVEPAPIRRVLVALRGYSSDAQALAWASMLAADKDVSVTALPLNESRTNALKEFSASVPHTCVKVRPGAPLVRIVAEAASGNYDVLILTAEGEGTFVGQVLAELERSDAHPCRPVLILKPTI